MYEDRQKNIAEFATWSNTHITGDEKGQAQIFLDRLFRAFGQRGVHEAGEALESDYRYRVESNFDTFPWPLSPTKKQFDAVAAVGRVIRRPRTGHCIQP